MDQLQDKRRSNCTVHQEEWLVGKHGRKSANECVNVVSAKKYVRSTLRSEMSWRKLQQNFWGKLL